MYRSTAPVLVLAGLLAGCAASQPPGAELPWRSDASINVGEYRLAARGTAIADDVVRVELQFVRVGDPSRVIAKPSLLVPIGESGSVEIDDGVTTVSALVKTEPTETDVIIEVDATLAENGITRSSPRIRFAIDPSADGSTMTSVPTD